MATTDDMLTTQKNMVTAFNGFTNNQSFFSGKLNSLELSTSTAIKTSSGWVAKISVIVAGTTSGMIYDASSIATAVTGTRLYPITNAIGIQTVNMATNNGIVFVPGTGMIVSICYS